MTATITVDLKANLARFSGQLDKATADLNKFQSNADRMAKSVSSSFKLLGGTIAVGAITAFAKTTLDAADALKDMSDRTQVTVRDLASLKTVAEQSGTDLESVGKAISKLSLSFSQAQGGAKEQAEAFKRLGVSSTDARERLFQLADAYANSSDKTRILADLQKVLGKSYADMLPLLTQGGEELRKAAIANESFAESMARLAPEADKFNDQLSQLKTNAAGLSATILSAVVPSLNEYVSALQKINKEGTLLEKLGFYTLGYVPERIANDIGNVTDRIKAYREEIAKLKAEGKNTSALEKTLGELITKQVTELQKTPARKPGSVDLSAIAAGKSKTGTKTDPLASFLKDTDTARLKEYNALVADLLRRMAKSKGDTTQFVEALDAINKKFADTIGMKDAAQQYDLGGGIMGNIEDLQSLQDAYSEANAEDKAFQESLKSTQRELLDLVEPTAAIIRELTKLDTLDGIVDPAILAARRLQLNEQIDALGKVGEETKKTKDLGAELGILFESAFTSAIGGGAKFQDVMKALLADVLKLIAQMLILEPLMKSMKEGFASSGSSGSSSIGGAVSSLFSDAGSWISGLFGFANGGIMTGAGPMPLNRYAMGGIANSPQFAMFGEGSKPEAYVPLPDGRRIPVHMQGGGGSQINNITIKTDNPASIRASRGQLMSDISNQLGRAQRYR